MAAGPAEARSLAAVAIRSDLKHATTNGGTAAPGGLSSSYAFTRVAAAVVASSRAEAGCISYNVYGPLSGADEYIFFEEWTDQAALDFHFETPHFQRFIQEFTQLLAAPPDIRTYEVSASRTLEL